MTSPPLDIFAALEADLIDKMEEADAKAHTPENRRNSTGTYQGGKAAGLMEALDAVARVRALVNAEAECYREFNAPGICWSGQDEGSQS